MAALRVGLGALLLLLSLGTPSGERGPEPEEAPACGAQLLQRVASWDVGVAADDAGAAGDAEEDTAEDVDAGAKGKTALLIIDVQDCFLEKDTTTGEPGSLAVPASHIIPVINKIREKKDCLFDKVVYSKDFHPPNHISFGSTHGLAPFSHLAGRGGLPIVCLKPASGDALDAACCPKQYVDPSAVNCTAQLCPPSDFTWEKNNSAFVANNPACEMCKADPASCFEDVQLMWTDHCLQKGDSTFPPSLTTKSSDIVMEKGANVYVDAYSAFMDNSKNLRTKLDAILQEHGVKELYVAGIATDVCVRWTVEDALSNLTRPYKVKVISDASAGLPFGGTPTQLHEDALLAMAAEGAEIVTSAEVLSKKCKCDKRRPAWLRRLKRRLRRARKGIKGRL